MKTRAFESNPNLFEMPWYGHEQCIRTHKEKGGGTSLYILTSIQYRRRDELTFL